MKKNFITITLLLLANVGFSQNNEFDLFHKAETLLNEKEFGKAILIFDEVLKINSTHVGAHLYKALSNQNLKNYTEAIVGFENAIKVDSLNTQALYEIANTYKAIKNHEKAIQYYNKAEKTLDNNTYNNPKYTVLKRIFINEMHPFYIPKKDILYKRGLLYFNVKKYFLAYKDFSNIEIDNRDKDSQYMLAFSLLKLKKIKKGCVELDKAISLGSKSALEIKNEYCNP